MINTNYANLKNNYLFSTVAEKVRVYSEAHPQADIIKLGIGDVTKPLAKTVIQALHDAVDENAKAETFMGYGPEQGYAFLREALADYYGKLGADIDADEVFVSDGAKSDIANILDIFSKDCHVVIPDPVYPVYLDTNVMDGRKVSFLNANEGNNFLPMPEDLGTDEKVDILYLCSPNNPTGACYNKDQLQTWVDFANAQGAVIFFDSAYEVFASGTDLPRTIFAIPGARTCAIEIASLSKTAGFTGTRCSYTVVPKELVRDGQSLKDMWFRRQSTKFNGTPYIVQKAAAAVFTEEGYAEIMENIQGYKENAKIIADTLDELGIYYTGGHYSPYVWLKCPNNMSSWEFFDFLLEKAQVVGTPGEGFGKNGEGFFRLTAFNTPERTREAMERLKEILK
ncbi:MAG: LL-diaminopimelate aminotransferase [Peptococcaceae bacterium]|jgi:LL-diaminopimelate aminotransferase|nr:LL-diaminopimelate aminotransferase [Peptococcaceae bacterium]MEE0205334.1 LL-diaminopimelate aminotransferase [Peptococcaceae bacterium]